MRKVPDVKDRLDKVLYYATVMSLLSLTIVLCVMLCVYIFGALSSYGVLR